MFAIDPKLLLKLNKPAPRYTSYPTAPEWGPLASEVYAQRLKALPDNAPLSLYFHIPFCKSMCLYCGCSVVLNRKEENEVLYVDYLIKEIQLVCALMGNKKQVAQLHFGGGTPTKLSIPLFTRLFKKIQDSFIFATECEISIEIDPRTVMEAEGEKLRFLKELGFNRVSFGVQDTDPKVQEAVKRHQSLKMTEETYHLARTLGFEGINIDLIYGLPYQTPATFETTTTHILRMRPDRIALFSYAKVPWLKPHQNAMKEETLPTVEEKFEIYTQARRRFVDNGYVAIGMDHFALESDPMAWGYRNKALQRNFQGYSLHLAEEMLSFGITSIGFTGGAYIQNLKELTAYYAALDQDTLPIHRGLILSQEDHLRKWVIHTLMCNFALDKQQFEIRFHTPFDTHFKEELQKLPLLEEEGLVLNSSCHLEVTPLGELFIRNIAMVFDGYSVKSGPTPKFSQSI